MKKRADISVECPYCGRLISKNAVKCKWCKANIISVCRGGQKHDTARMLSFLKKILGTIKK